MSVRFIPLANINGKPGAKGDKGDTGTFAGATAVSVPAGDPAEVSLSGPESAKVANFKIPRGLPGTNAAANDEAFATYINAIDSDTRSALENRFIGKDTLVFNALDHGIAGDGATDDTASMQALINSVPAGATITAPPGSTFRTDGWTVEGKSVTLDFSGSHLVKTSAEPILVATGSYGAPISVGGVSTNPGGSTVTVADSSSFAVGDLVKVVSDDAISDARGSIDGFPKQGQHAIVTSISGNDLVVMPPLYDSYSTNIRVFKMDTSVNVSLSAATVDYDEAAGGGGGQAYYRYYFWFESLFAPRVTIGHAKRGPGGLLYFVDCVRWFADVKFSNLPAEDGYGVNSVASILGDAKIDGFQCRHGFTDGPARASAPPGPAAHGRSMWNRVTGSVSGSAQAGIDTHHATVGNKFHNIIVTGALAQGAVCFEARGTGHEFINCTATDARFGFRFFEELGEYRDGVTSSSNKMIGCVTSRVRQAFTLDTRYDAGITPTVYIIGGVFEAGFGSNGGRFMESANAQIHVQGAVFRWIGAGAPTGGAYFALGGTDLIGSCSIDSRMLSSGTPDAMFRWGSGSTAQVDLDVGLTLGTYERQNISALARFNDAEGEVRARVNADTSMLPAANLTKGPATQKVQMSVLRTNRAGAATAYRQLSLTAGAPITLGRGSDPNITVRVTAGSAVTAGEIDAGTHLGQRLTIVCGRNSPAAVTVPLAQGNETLQPGESVSLVYAGAPPVTPAWERA